MNTGHTRRLMELRRRTDCQLAALVRNEIEGCLTLARRSSYSQAEAKYANARTLLALTQASAAQRAELERLLDEARSVLDANRAMAYTAPWC